LKNDSVNSGKKRRRYISGPDLAKIGDGGGFVGGEMYKFTSVRTLSYKK